MWVFFIKKNDNELVNPHMKSMKSKETHTGRWGWGIRTPLVFLDPLSHTWYWKLKTNVFTSSINISYIIIKETSWSCHQSPYWFKKYPGKTTSISRKWGKVKQCNMIEHPVCSTLSSYIYIYIYIYIASTIRSSQSHKTN